MPNKATFSPFLAALPLPGWKSLLSSAKLFPFALQYFQYFSRKAAALPTQLQISALVLLPLQAALSGSLCVTGSPAQVHNRGLSPAPHNCMALAPVLPRKITAELRESVEVRTCK